MGELENMDEKSIIFDKRAFSDVLGTMRDNLYHTASEGREHSVENVPVDFQTQLDKILSTLDDLFSTLEEMVDEVDYFTEPEQGTKEYVIYKGTRYESISGVVIIDFKNYRTLLCPYEGCNWACLASESYKLAEHTKIHRPDEFHCPLCDFTSKTLEGFSEHLLKVHGYGDQAMLDTVAQQMGKRKRS